MANGIDKKERIIETAASYPVLHNVSHEMVARFRDQITLVDCQFQGDPAVIRKAV